MESWWRDLTLLNKVFAGSAFFFSLVFIWQVVMSVLGVDGGADSDTDHSGAGQSFDHSVAHGADQAGEQAVFSLVSVRSLTAFGTLFSWAGTLYLMDGKSIPVALIYSLVWGVGGMFLVSYLLHRLVRLQETGNVSLWNAMGREGEVYMDVPSEGVGKVKVLVGGVLSFVNAKSSDGCALPAGTKVRVVDVLDGNTLSIKATEMYLGE